MSEGMRGADGCWPSGGGGRNNNFNLVRLAAAILVVFSHSHSLTLHASPVSLGLALGDIAVDIFFVTSGFLIAGTIMSRRDAIFFLRSRILRIFPALLIAVVLVVFVLGPLVSVLPASAYFGDPQPYRFLFANASLTATEVQTLPGVFADNPIRFIVMHPLWSLEWEVAMYLTLFLFSLPYLLSERYRSVGPDAMRVIFPMIFLSALLLLLYKFMRDNMDSSAPLLIVDVRLRVIAMFFGGVSAWLWRERIGMAAKHGLLLVLPLLVAASLSPMAFIPVYYLSVVWLTLIVGRADPPELRRANRIGDYSYGIYIYSFPVQQTVAALWVGIGPYTMFGMSMLCTLPLAFLSWHLVEKRALVFKSGFRKGAAVLERAAAPAGA